MEWLKPLPVSYTHLTGNKQGPGQLKEEIAKWENITLGAFADYNRTFADVHSVSAMLGMTAEQETYKTVSYTHLRKI